MKIRKWIHFQMQWYRSSLELKVGSDEKSKVESMEFYKQAKNIIKATSPAATQLLLKLNQVKQTSTSRTPTFMCERAIELER